MMDDAGFPEATICASSDLDEYLINSLKDQGACIDSWGVGTNLITSKDCPAFGGVYKLAAVKRGNEFLPKIKLSENPVKITNPGNKTVWRIYDRESGKIRADLIAMAHEKYDENEPLMIFDPADTWKKTYLQPGTYTLREIMVPIFIDGKCVYTSPTVKEIKAYCAKEQETLWEESRRLVNPHKVHVDLSNELYQVKRNLLDSINNR